MESKLRDKGIARNCDEGNLYNLQGDQETFHWHLISAGKNQLMPAEENLCRGKILKLLERKDQLHDVKQISHQIGFSEQHTRRIIRHLFSEELLFRKDQKTNNGRQKHLYGIN